MRSVTGDRKGWLPQHCLLQAMLRLGYTESSTSDCRGCRTEVCVGAVQAAQPRTVAADVWMEWPQIPTSWPSMIKSTAQRLPSVHLFAVCAGALDVASDLQAQYTLGSGRRRCTAADALADARAQGPHRWVAYLAQAHQLSSMLDHAVIKEQT